MTWTRAAIAILAVVVLGLLLFFLLVVGPFADPSPSPSASASSSAEPSPSESATPSATESSTEPSASLPEPGEGWICGEPITLNANTVDVAHTADVRIGTHEGYDRIVFEYLEDGTPALEMRLAQPPFVEDASGLPMTVNGSPVMAITLTGATKLADDGSLTYTGATEFEPGFPQLVHLIERGDFEAVNSWYVGLDGGNCMRTALLTNPSRIAIDLQH